MKNNRKISLSISSLSNLSITPWSSSIFHSVGRKPIPDLESKNNLNLEEITDREKLINKFDAGDDIMMHSRRKKSSKSNTSTKIGNILGRTSVGSEDEIEDLLKGPSYYRRSQLSHRIHITNVSRHTKPRDILEMFKTFGEIRSLEIKSDYAFLEYEEEKSAELAIEYTHHSRLDRNGMIAEEALPKRKTHLADPDDICYNCGKKGHW